MQVKASVDITSFQDGLTLFERQQMPFALAQSLTRTVTAARAKVQQVMPQVFDRPTTSTIQGVRFRPARKDRLEEGAAVFILDEGNGKSLSPNKWLISEVDGGRRADKRLEVALKMKGLMPKDAQTAASKFAPLDAYGNLRGSFVVQLMSILNLLGETGYAANRTARSKAKKKNPIEYFIGRPEKRGRVGVWQRIDTAFGSAIRPILYFIKPPSYRKRLPFYAIVDEVAQARGLKELRQSLDDALKTAFNKASK